MRTLILITLVLTGLFTISGAAAQRPNGAGVVIRHGDGTLIYAYVQFEEESISGEELLLRTGLDAAYAPFGGLGAGVCRIDGEGCPAGDCYCHSYSTPAFFWHYYTEQDGAWVEAPFGATSREVRDGDIDGWSWTSGDPGLPPVTIDEIAELNGVDRNPPTPTEPPPPTATPPPTPTATPPPTPIPPTTTPLPPSPTTAPPATATPTPAQAVVATSPASATPRPSATMTAPPTATSLPAATPALTAVEVARGDPSPTAPAAATSQPTSLAVIVRPSATPEVLEPQANSDGGSGDLVVFGALAAGVAVIGAGAMLYRRRGEH